MTYGLNIQAWCVFLLAAHHVPVERCAGIIAALTGTRYLRAVLTNLRIDQPVAASIYRLTARVARTIVSAGAGE